MATVKSNGKSKAAASASEEEVELTPEQKEAKDQQDKISKDVEEKRALELANKAQDSPFTGTFPTVGRIVHFYPSVNDKQALDGDVQFVAAIVVKATGHQRCDLRIFPATEERDRWTLRTDIPHQSKANELIVDGAYWEWPPRS